MAVSWENPLAVPLPDCHPVNLFALTQCTIGGFPDRSSNLCGSRVGGLYFDFVGRLPAKRLIKTSGFFETLDSTVATP